MTLNLNKKSSKVRHPEGTKWQHQNYIYTQSKLKHCSGTEALCVAWVKHGPLIWKPFSHLVLCVNVKSMYSIHSALHYVYRNTFPSNWHLTLTFCKPVFIVHGALHTHTQISLSICVCAQSKEGREMCAATLEDDLNPKCNKCMHIMLYRFVYIRYANAELRLDIVINNRSNTLIGSINSHGSRIV